MKLRQKFMVCALAAVMTVGSVVSVSAAGLNNSPTADVTASDPDSGVTVSNDFAETEEFADIQQVMPEVADMITQVNEGTMEMDAFIEELNNIVAGIEDEEVKAAMEEAIKSLDGMTFITDFNLMNIPEDMEKNENDKYEVTFNVPSITDQTQNIKLLLINKEGEVYGVKIIEPKDINWETKEITVEFDELETNGFISFVADIAE